MEQKNDNRFDSAAQVVCERVRRPLGLLPADVKKKAQEIRLRVGRPVCISYEGGTLFVNERGGASSFPGSGCLIAGREDLEESFRSLCGYSIYSHENEIRSGFITMRGGHRVGLGGTAVLKDGEVGGMKDISSMNIRIARQVTGAADALLGTLKDRLNDGLLLAGPPSSGKTTILRDIARQLSGGMRGGFRRVAVVDERGEIAGTWSGEPQNDLGLCCDVLDGYPKAEGILLAVRSLSPQIIICDELGSDSEAAAVEQCMNAGVCMIASIHAGSAGQLLKRKQASRLLETGAFASVAMLEGGGQPGRIARVYETGDLIAEGGGSGASHLLGIPGGVYGVAQAFAAR